jgi:hypothetical protein
MPFLSEILPVLRRIFSAPRARTGLRRLSGLC